MYYIYDHSHSNHSQKFEKGLEKILSNLDRAEVFIENVNFSAKEKRIKDRIWNNWINDAAEIKDNRLYDAENNISLSAKDLIVAKAAYESRDNIVRIDTGPVFPEDMEKNARKISKAQSGSEEIDLNFIAEHTARRDVLTAKYIFNRCQNPDETLIIMGSSHNLDRLLENQFNILFPIDIPTSPQGNKEVKELALNVLKDNDYL